VLAVRQRRGRRAVPGVLVLLTAALIAAAPGGASAQVVAPDAGTQQAGTLLVVGQAGQPVALSRADLAQLPSATVSLTREHEHGTPTAYAGPLLWAVLDRAGAILPEARGRARQVVTVTGRDGYTAVVALAELDPEFEGKPVIVATQADGKPIGAGALRLVVPGDKRAGRSVRDPAKVVVR
jgi:hypothetical protein